MDEKKRAPAHHEVEAETARGVYEAVRPEGYLWRGVDALVRVADGVERVGREIARGVDALETIAQGIHAAGIVGAMLGGVTRHMPDEALARALRTAREVDAPPSSVPRDPPAAPDTLDTDPPATVERKTFPPPR